MIGTCFYCGLMKRKQKNLFAVARRRAERNTRNTVTRVSKLQKMRHLASLLLTHRGCVCLWLGRATTLVCVCGRRKERTKKPTITTPVDLDADVSRVCVWFLMPFPDDAVEFPLILDERNKHLSAFSWRPATNKKNRRSATSLGHHLSIFVAYGRSSAD